MPSRGTLIGFSLSSRVWKAKERFGYSIELRPRVFNVPRPSKSAAPVSELRPDEFWIKRAEMRIGVSCDTYPSKVLRITSGRFELKPKRLSSSRTYVWHS